MFIVIIQSVMAARNTFSNSKPSTESRPIPTHLSAYNTPTNLLTASLLNSSLSTAVTSNLSGTATSNILTAATSNLLNTYHSNTTSKSSSNNIREPKIKDHPKLEIGDGCTSTDSSSSHQQLGSHQWNLGTGPTQNPNSQHYLSLLMTPEDAASSNQGIKQQQPPINNISLITITENKSLDLIFPFELEEPSDMPLFSGTALEEKPITAIYTNAKVNGHSIKLILNSVDRAVNTRIITTNGATKTPIGKIDDFPIEVNSIVVLIKVLMMEAIQYQALVVLSQNSRHIQVLATCGHFKATNTTAPLINFKEEKPKPTWEAYQNTNHNLEELPSWEWDKREKGKGKAKEEKPLPIASTCCGDDKEYQMATKFYCCACLVKCFGRPKQVGKWDNTLCLACGETLFDEGMWNNISGRGETCDETCQIVSVKTKNATTSELLEIKNNPLALPEPEYILIFDVFSNIENNLEEFYEHYQ
ncbi:hypothetical protein G9A89_014578 [Geosiphon pyriformis]|nr:hypothetical protein G9A89_014578 [Geosiphon pyriformis]